MLCFSLTKYICLTQNETNFSAVYQTQENKKKTKKMGQVVRKQKDLHKLDLGESLLWPLCRLQRLIIQTEKGPVGLSSQ